MIYPLSDCKNQSIPESTNVWQFCVIFPKCQIGENCNIIAHVLIENDVKIGNNVSIKSGVHVWDGVTIEDNAFIGPNVSFTNDLFPGSKVYSEKFERTIVKRGASIGANATILAGVTIGEYAMIGAGAVATKDVPAAEIWVGNPAQKLCCIHHFQNQVEGRVKFSNFTYATFDLFLSVA